MIFTRRKTRTLLLGLGFLILLFCVALPVYLGGGLAYNVKVNEMDADMLDRSFHWRPFPRNFLEISIIFKKNWEFLDLFVNFSWFSRHFKKNL